MRWAIDMLEYILLTLVIPAVLFYLAKFLWRAYILSTARDPSSNLLHLPIPPGDYGLPVVGETFIWAIQGSRFNIIRRQKYGKIFSSNYIGKTMVKVTGPEYIKQILTASYDDVATIWPTSVRRVIGDNSIANSTGLIHKHRRKVFLKAFTHAALDSYIPQVHKVMRERVRSWLDLKDPVLIYPQIKRITFEVSFRVLVGLSFKDEEECKKLYEAFDTMTTNLFSLPYEYPGSGFSKALKAKAVIHGLLEQHLKEKRKKVREAMNRGEYAAESYDESLKNAMHYVIESEYLEQDRIKMKERKESEKEVLIESLNDGDEDGQDCPMSEDELKETTVEMLFAGYQTVASSGTSAVINLIKHPDVFRKIQDELRSFGLLQDDEDIHEQQLKPNGVGTPNNNNTIISTEDVEISKHSERKKYQFEEREITLESLSKMHYLEQVMRETLRIMPPVLGGYRVARKTFQLGRYRIPKGWTIIYNIRDTHESEWDEDKEFNPDRFSQENWTDNRESRFRWIPFGGGRRICVGKEFARIQFKLLIIELVKTFTKMEFAKGKPPRMFAIPLLHPTDNLPVKLTPRDGSLSRKECKKER